MAPWGGERTKARPDKAVPVQRWKALGVASEEPDRQGLRDAATILPFAAAALLAPPLIWIFAGPTEPGRVPLIIVYIFGIWAVIILAAFLLAQRIARLADEHPRRRDNGGP